MSEQSIRERAERGVLLAATQRPYRLNDFWVVSGYFTDGETCACDDFTYRGGPCKHCFAALVWIARESTRGEAA